MTLKIDRLNITLPATAGQTGLAARQTGQQFAQALTRRLAQADLTAHESGRIDRLELPPVVSRPGEGSRQLADRVARAILSAVKQQRGGS